MGLIPRYGLYATQGLGDWVDSLHIEWIPTRSGPNNWVISPHIHKSFLQVLYLTSGSVKATIGPQTWQLSAPCILSIPEQNVHAFHFSEDVDGPVITAVQHLLEVLVGATAPDLLRQIREPIAIQLSPDHSYADTLMPLFNAIRLAFDNHGIGRSSICMSLFAALFVHIACIEHSEGIPGQLGGTRKAEQLRKFHQLVQRRFRERTSLAVYADELGMTVGHLSRLCREALGMSALDVVNARVVHEIQRKLIYTSTPIKALAASLGFEDEAYFSRFFRKHTGYRPSEFRDHVREQLARDD